MTFIFQVFEDGATYRGRQKNLVRPLVHMYYRSALSPDIQGNYNSAQEAEIIKDAVQELLDDLKFHLATELDQNVRLNCHL